MNDTVVSDFTSDLEPETVLARLADALPGMSPQLRKAGQHVLDNHNDMGVSSIRETAEAAGVTPNSLVRMAQAIGFDGYEDLRRPFREALRSGQESFPDRARWLQSLARGGRHGGLFSEMAATTIENVEQLFSGTTAAEVRAAADAIVGARKSYILGVGVSYGLAQNFAYLARMALDTVVAVPQDGSLPIDDIARAKSEDVLLAMTFKPYRTEVVDAVRAAHDQGTTVIALTDARTSPIALLADHRFVFSTQTPQFFTSIVSAAALLETILAFVIADADPKVIAAIERFHQRRVDLGVYHPE